MNFPGAPGRAYGGGGDTAGMSEQERAMVKAVSFFTLIDFGLLFCL